MIVNCTFILLKKVTGVTLCSLKREVYDDLIPFTESQVCSEGLYYSNSDIYHGHNISHTSMVNNRRNQQMEN
jgi:hypothetical protein